MPAASPPAPTLDVPETITKNRREPHGTSHAKKSSRQHRPDIHGARGIQCLGCRTGATATARRRPAGGRDGPEARANHGRRAAVDVGGRRRRAGKTPGHRLRRLPQAGAQPAAGAEHPGRRPPGAARPRYRRRGLHRRRVPGRNAVRLEQRPGQRRDPGRRLRHLRPGAGRGAAWPAGRAVRRQLARRPREVRDQCAGLRRLRHARPHRRGIGGRRRRLVPDQPGGEYSDQRDARRARLGLVPEGARLHRFDRHRRLGPGQGHQQGRELWRPCFAAVQAAQGLRPAADGGRAEHRHRRPQHRRERSGLARELVRPSDPVAIRAADARHPLPRLQRHRQLEPGQRQPDLVDQLQHPEAIRARGSHDQSEPVRRGQPERAQRPVHGHGTGGQEVHARAAPELQRRRTRGLAGGSLLHRRGGRPGPALPRPGAGHDDAGHRPAAAGRRGTGLELPRGRRLRQHHHPPEPGVRPRHRRPLQP